MKAVVVIGIAVVVVLCVGMYACFWMSDKQDRIDGSK